MWEEGVDVEVRQRSVAVNLCHKSSLWSSVNVCVGGAKQGEGEGGGCAHTRMQACDESHATDRSSPLLPSTALICQRLQAAMFGSPK